jgi:hypothetical protein
MIEDRKPELTLYVGSCHADGCSEGYFRIERGDLWTINRYHRAIDSVERYLRLGWGYNFQECMI